VYRESDAFALGTGPSPARQAKSAEGTAVPPTSGISIPPAPNLPAILGVAFQRQKEPRQHVEIIVTMIATAIQIVRIPTAGG